MAGEDFYANDRNPANPAKPDPAAPLDNAACFM
jgi:hypothetical protein